MVSEINELASRDAAVKAVAILRSYSQNSALMRTGSFYLRRFPIISTPEDIGLLVSLCWASSAEAPDDVVSSVCLVTPVDCGVIEGDVDSPREDEEGTYVFVPCCVLGLLERSSPAELPIGNGPLESPLASGTCTSPWTTTNVPLGTNWLTGTFSCPVVLADGV